MASGINRDDWRKHLASEPEQISRDKRVALRPVLAIRKSATIAPLPEAQSIANICIPARHGFPEAPDSHACGGNRRWRSRTGNIAQAR